MTDSIVRMEQINGGPLTQVIGPIDVDSCNLYGSTGHPAPLTWGMGLNHVRDLGTYGGPGPIIFSAEDGQFVLTLGVGEGWRLYVEIKASGRDGLLFEWESSLAGDSQYNGPTGVVDFETWYFATPPIEGYGQADIIMRSAEATGPDEEFQLVSLRFWLFS